jgi:hypothetical protein
MPLACGKRIQAPSCMYSHLFLSFLLSCLTLFSLSFSPLLPSLPPSLSFWKCLLTTVDRLCHLVVRPGYRSRCPGFDSRCYRIFWEVVGLEQGPLSPVSTIDELLGRNTRSNGSSLENREYGFGDPLCWLRNTLYRQKSALTSPTSGGHFVGIVRSPTKVTQFFFYWQLCLKTCLPVSVMGEKCFERSSN